MSSSSTTTEPTVRETPEVAGDDNANARAAVHSANKPGAAYAAAVANGESDRAWIRRVVLLLTGQAFSLLGSNIVQYAIWWWIVLQTKTGSAMLRPRCLAWCRRPSSRFAAAPGPTVTVASC